MPSRARANVVLPQPDSPTSPSVSPRQIAAETPPRARTEVPCWPKIFVRSSISIRGSPRLSTCATPSRSAAIARGSSCARSWKKQRLTWPRPTCTSSGLSVWQTSLASAQRSANTQPGQIRADRGQVARDRVQSAVILAHAAARDAAQQADGVRMPRIVQDLLGRAFLDHLARVEHPDPRAHLADHAEVVADEQHGGMELGLESGDEVEHLGLDRGVEAGGRLVEDQERRVDAECHGDHDALLHAAGELVRVALHDRGRVGDLHLAQHRERALLRLAATRAARREDLRQLLAHADGWIERRARVLVDHRHHVAAIAPQGAAREREHVLARHGDRSRADAAVARQVADRRHGGRRLAAARLAHEAVGAAPLDGEADAAQDGFPGAANAVVDAQVANFERRGRGCRAHRFGRRHRAHRSITCWRLSASIATATHSEMIAMPGKSMVQ